MLANAIACLLSLLVSLPLIASCARESEKQNASLKLQRLEQLAYREGGGGPGPCEEGLLGTLSASVIVSKDSGEIIYSDDQHKEVLRIQMSLDESVFINVIDALNAGDFANYPPRVTNEGIEDAGFFEIRAAGPAFKQEVFVHGFDGVVLDAAQRLFREKYSHIKKGGQATPDLAVLKRYCGVNFLAL